MADIMKEAREGTEYLYVSFDIDTLEPGGLTPREAFPIVRRLCAENNLVGFQLVELSPHMDRTYASAPNANRILRECLTGPAMNRKGITEPDGKSPLAVTHGQDAD